ncbi:MAG: hypothetical protein U0324_36500 [Polyangiales bacterium]
MAGPARRPIFLFVVDTEGDSEWTHHRRVPPVRNLLALPRFQALCDRYGVAPTYVVTWSVAADGDAMGALREWQSRGRAEVGTHLHPWTTPPFGPHDDDNAFPSELPADVLRDKLAALTEEVATRAGRAPTAYRAGRFGVDGRTLRELARLGYVVDSSVTPLTSWRAYPGLRGGPGGPDFRAAPLAPYFPSEDDPTRPGASPVLEVPLTIVERARFPLSPRGDGPRWSVPPPAADRVLRALRLRQRLWLRPTMETAAGMVDACAEAARQGVGVFNMMIHSSELFPNTSPYFPDQRAVDALFERIDRTFEAVFTRWTPQALTLTDAARRLAHGARNAEPLPP